MADANMSATIPRRHHIGIDVGTSSVRALIVDQEGKQLAFAVENIDEWQPQSKIHVSH